MSMDETWTSGGVEVSLHQGDITELEVDAVVNAANSRLAGGGGVDGAIHGAGGPEILEECRAIIRKIGRLETGRAVITTAGEMRAKRVIHTVGPVYSAGRAKEQAVQLGDCYRSSLMVAAENGLLSVAFPSISTGAYGYPVEDAARVAVSAVIDALPGARDVRRVVFCVFGGHGFEVYRKAIGAKIAKDLQPVNVGSANPKSKI